MTSIVKLPEEVAEAVADLGLDKDVWSYTVDVEIDGLRDTQVLLDRDAFHAQREAAAEGLIGINAHEWDNESIQKVRNYLKIPTAKVTFAKCGCCEEGHIRPLLHLTYTIFAASATDALLLVTRWVAEGGYDSRMAIVVENTTVFEDEDDVVLQDGE